MVSPVPFELMNSAPSFNLDQMAKEVWGQGGSRDDDDDVLFLGFGN